MVVPARRAKNWLFDAAKPEGAGVWTGSRSIDESAIQRYSGPARRPRLHYHRSGLTTLDFQGEAHGRRVQVNLQPLAEVTGRQVFVISQTVPQSLPDAGLPSKRSRGGPGPRGGDLFVFSHHGWPELIYVSGVMIQHKVAPWLRPGDYLSDEAGPDWPALQGVQGDRFHVGLDLSGCGVESWLFLKFGMQARRPLGIASTSLLGLCGHKRWPSPSVAAWTDDGYQAAFLLDRDQLPKFPFDKRRRGGDRRQVQRRADGSDPRYGEAL